MYILRGNTSLLLDWYFFKMVFAIKHLAYMPIVFTFHGIVVYYSFWLEELSGLMKQGI